MQNLKPYDRYYTDPGIFPARQVLTGRSPAGGVRVALALNSPSRAMNGVQSIA
jgi:hypothetical protein